MSVTVQLKTPIRGHRGEIKSITFKKPTFGMLMEYGEPHTVAHKDGITIINENVATLRLYQEACVDCDPNFLELVDFDDAIALKDAILGFFQKARMAPASTPSVDTPASSPSASAETFTPSIL